MQFGNSVNCILIASWGFTPTPESLGAKSHCVSVTRVLGMILNWNFANLLKIWESLRFPNPNPFQVLGGCSSSWLKTSTIISLEFFLPTDAS